MDSINTTNEALEASRLESGPFSSTPVGPECFGGEDFPSIDPDLDRRIMAGEFSSTQVPLDYESRAREMELENSIDQVQANNPEPGPITREFIAAKKAKGEQIGIVEIPSMTPVDDPSRPWTTERIAALSRKGDLVPPPEVKTVDDKRAEQKAIADAALAEIDGPIETHNKAAAVFFDRNRTREIYRLLREVLVIQRDGTIEAIAELDRILVGE